MPRFTLRDLFWLTLVVGCLCAWSIDREKLEFRIRELDSYWVSPVMRHQK